MLRDLAGAYTRLGRKDEAEAQFKKAIALRPDSWSLYWYYGGFLYRLNRYQEAEAAFTLALARVPDNARLWSSLGGTLLALGRTEEAQTGARAVARAPADRVGGIQSRDAATTGGGDYPAAVSDYEKATDLSPRDYRMWRNLAAGLRQGARPAGPRGRGLPESARPGRTGARARPESTGGSSSTWPTARACSATSRGRWRSPRRRSSWRPKNSEVQYMAADIYETLGDRTSALHCLERALRAGYQRTLLETSPSFANLRTDPRYKKLIASLPASRRETLVN